MPILSSYSRSFLWQQSHDLIWQLRRVKIRIDQMAMCAAMTGSSKVGGDWGAQVGALTLTLIEWLITKAE